MYKKRGQVSIFLILALLLLLVAGVYFYAVSERNVEPEFDDPRAEEIHTYMESCMIQVADQAIRQLGMTGGYIEYPVEIENDPRSYLALGPIGLIKSPYWWFDGKENVPTEAFMIAQLEKKVAAELPTCVESLTAFRSYDITELEKPEVVIRLNENDVGVEATYPLRIKYLDGDVVQLEKFSDRIPIKLKKVIELAKDLMAAENKQMFLEFKTIDLITMDEDIPTTDIEATCQEKIWLVDDVTKKLQRLLQTNLPYINVQGTEFDPNLYVPNPFGEDTYRDSYFNAHYIWKVSDKDYDGLSASFNYDPGWPTQVYVRPSTNGVMKSNAQRSQDLLKFLCLHIWHFTYDVHYPVRVSVIDNEAADPYIFTFAFKVQVDHNQPKRELVPFTLFEKPELELNQEEFCNDVSRAVTINTVENGSDEDFITDVNLTFTCGPYTCPIGQTEWISFGAAAGLTKEFPVCNNGILRAEKEGYEPAQTFISTEAESFQKLALRPIKEFVEYEVVKHDAADPAAIIPLGENEQVSIMVQSAEDDFDSFAVYPNSGGLPLTLIRDDVQYQVDLFLTDGESITGGYQHLWGVSREEVENANKVVFHVLEHTGSEDEQALFIAGLQSYSNQIPEPELQ